mgnify:CR=1 FL=1
MTPGSRFDASALARLAARRSRSDADLALSANCVGDTLSAADFYLLMMTRWGRTLPRPARERIERDGEALIRPAQSSYRRHQPEGAAALQARHGGRLDRHRLQPPVDVGVEDLDRQPRGMAGLGEQLPRARRIMREREEGLVLAVDRRRDEAARGNRLAAEHRVDLAQHLGHLR